jgi:hypothetical protein
MIAVFVFFTATCAILGVVMQGLRGAKLLKNNGPTAGMVAGELTLTNKLEEGVESGDFGDLYRDYSWEREVKIYGTNGLFQVDIAILHHRTIDSEVSLLMYRPESQSGAPPLNRQ